MRHLLAIVIAIASTGAAACDDAPGTAGLGEPCGGRGGAACGPDQYCDFGRNRCGADDMPGRCAARPATCPALLVPERTCACDGKVYSSACEAQLAGADLDQSGTCPLDPGAFACGYRQCKRTNQYCQRAVSDIGDEGDAFACLGLPAGCGTTPSCSCLAGQTCADRCTGDANGLTLTCPGG